MGVFSQYKSTGKFAMCEDMFWSCCQNIDATFNEMLSFLAWEGVLKYSLVLLKTSIYA